MKSVPSLPLNTNCSQLCYERILIAYSSQDTHSQDALGLRDVFILRREHSAGRRWRGRRWGTSRPVNKRERQDQDAGNGSGGGSEHHPGSPKQVPRVLSSLVTRRASIVLWTLSPASLGAPGSQRWGIAWLINFLQDRGTQRWALLACFWWRTSSFMLLTSPELSCPQPPTQISHSQFDLLFLSFCPHKLLLTQLWPEFPPGLFHFHVVASPYFLPLVSKCAAFH